jgi:hypothetical protein
MKIKEKKIVRLNKYHLIRNFPKRFSYFKRILGNIIFFILVTKVTLRKNHLAIADYLAAKDLIKAGDVILAGGFRSVSHFFMGKFFTHSLLYAGGGECIHASADGVDTITLEELFTEYDTLIILRPEISSEAGKIVGQVVDFARSQIGKPFDFYLEHHNDSYFCTQLVKKSFDAAGFDVGVGVQPKIRQDFLWIFWRIRRALRADDFLRGNFTKIFISEGLKEKNKEIEALCTKFKKNIIDSNL